MSANAPPNSCGCCAGVSVETPLVIYNRPGLPAIAYRVGSHASVRKSLLARLSDSDWPVLRQLRTRDNDDFTIALLDAWAVTSDVLTFYQERIANESYLRTAAERLSILELARLLGYQLAPGLAASTYLAFTMEESPGAPQLSAKPLQLAIGTRAQSVPGPDEQPQSFETIEAIEARVEWNAILPQLTETQTLAWDMKQLWLEGVNLTLSVGDVLLIIADAAGTKQASLQRVTKVSADANANRTGVTLAAISTTAQTVIADSPGVFVMRTIASSFGHNAPLKPVYNKRGQFQNLFTEWDFEGENTSQMTLSARNDKVFIGSWVVIEQDDPNVAKLAIIDTDPEEAKRIWTFSQVTGVTHRSVAKYGLAGSATSLTLSETWEVGSETTISILRSMVVAAQSEELMVGKIPLTYPFYESTLPFDTRVEGLTAGRPVAITGKRQHIRITSLSLASSAAIAAILPTFPKLILDEGGSVELQPGDVLSMAAPPLKFVVFKTVPLTPSEFGAALSEEHPPKLRLRLIDRDGKAGLLDIAADRIALEPASENDETIREIAFIDGETTTAIIHDRDRTTLQLATPLAYVYDRATVRINANVAVATHGESVQELLGSGDATIPYQTFTLRQPPLTYVSADTPSGSASTLKIFVNDVLWQEAPFFYGRGATRAYLHFAP